MGKYKMQTPEVDEVITIINTKGHEQAAQIVTQKYGMSYQSFRNRINREGKYTYNKALQKYELLENQTCEFLSIEELTLKRKVSHVDTSPIIAIEPSDSIEQLVQELIKDRLLEYNKFISLDRHTKQVSVNLSYLKHQGYEIKTL